jgi:hypothetical protein
VGVAVVPVRNQRVIEERDVHAAACCDVRTRLYSRR